MTLSKSDYIKFLKHPAWLWLQKHDKAKLPKPDANLQAIFDAGHEFEAYANQRFPDAVEIGWDKNDFNSYRTMPKRTEKALANKAPAVTQGRFEANNLTCICDVVKRVDDNTLDLYEIKSSTRVKPEHYHDLAFQATVLESAGFEVRNIAVVHVNNQYVRNGKVDPIELSKVKDITGKVRDYMGKTKNNIQKAFGVVESSTMPDPSPRHVGLGSLNDWMEIYKELEHVDDYSIYNLASPGTRRLAELEDRGIEHIYDIPEGINLTPKQQAQVLATKQNKRIINREKIQDFLNSLEYPLYFLDYETAMSTVPPYEGTRPYQQIPFQYSLHVIKNPGEDPTHTEYLHRSKSHPVPDLLQALHNDIGTTGNVIVWYKNFEMRCNNQMAEMAPEFNEFLQNINSRVVDLMEPFSNQWFVDKDFFGSSSIKSVLPVLVPELSYKDLTIQEGGAAQRLWMDAVIREKNDIDPEALFSDLVEYCKLDTLAMVRIWETLQQV